MIAIHNRVARAMLIGKSVCDLRNQHFTKSRFRGEIGDLRKYGNIFSWRLRSPSATVMAPEFPNVHAAFRRVAAPFNKSVQRNAGICHAACDRMTDRMTKRNAQSKNARGAPAPVVADLRRWAYNQHRHIT